MTTAPIAFPASVVPAGYTVAFDVPKFLQPESIVGVQGTSVPGTATENGRTYHFWFRRRTNGEVFSFGLSCNGQPIRNPAHKLALRAVILVAYRYATRGVDMAVQHDMHVEAELTARTAATVDLSGLCNVAPIGADEIDRPAVRACALRVSGTRDAVLVSDCDDDRPTSTLAPRYTLARLYQLDFAALWATIPPERQAEIGSMVLRQECANQVAIDSGFNTTPKDRDEAESISHEILNTLPGVVEAAIPDELPVLHDDPYPLWQVLGDAAKRGKPPLISVRGLPRRLRPVYHDGWFVRARGGLVRLGGAVNLASRNDDAAPVWEYLTLADIEAERQRRHGASRD